MRLYLCIVLLATTSNMLCSQTPTITKFEPSTVYTAGEDGYACFRIPAICHTTAGDILAFAEGRVGGCSDTGDIDLVVKRSTDEGQTWSNLQVVWDDDQNTCGNPVPIIDDQGTLHLLSTWNLGSDHERDIIAGTSTDTRRVFYLRSDDQGKTWTAPSDVTSTTKKEDWTWYATGPGSGMQISRGRHKGRLILGCDHIELDSKKYFSHCIYSDDRGSSWQLGGSTPQDQVNECEVAELSDGLLMLNMRNYKKGFNYRQTAISNDGGLSWKKQQIDSSLIEPRCMASLQHGVYDSRHVLLFSNPASKDSRSQMTVRISYDDGNTWPVAHPLHSGPSAYSDLVQLDLRTFACFYEAGQSSPYEQIVLQKFGIQE